MTHQQRLQLRTLIDQARRAQIAADGPICPTCGARVQPSLVGRRKLYCGKRCSDAAYLQTARGRAVTKAASARAYQRRKAAA